MNHTLFRQVSEPKARKRARRIEREGKARYVQGFIDSSVLLIVKRALPRSQNRTWLHTYFSRMGNDVNFSMTFRDSNILAVESDDDDNRAADVIDVNVVILHSKSSRALHRHLTSAASVASAAASCSTSREDVSAQESEKCFMQVS